MTDRETLLALRANAARNILRAMDDYVEGLATERTDAAKLVRENLRRARHHVEIALLAVAEEQGNGRDG